MYSTLLLKINFLQVYLYSSIDREKLIKEALKCYETDCTIPTDGFVFENIRDSSKKIFLTSLDSSVILLTSIATTMEQSFQWHGTVKKRGGASLFPGTGLPHGEMHKMSRISIMVRDTVDEQGMLSELEGIGDRFTSRECYQSWRVYLSLLNLVSEKYSN